MTVTNENGEREVATMIAAVFGVYSGIATCHELQLRYPGADVRQVLPAAIAQAMLHVDALWPDKELTRALHRTLTEARDAGERASPVELCNLISERFDDIANAVEAQRKAALEDAAVEILAGYQSRD